MDKLTLMEKFADPELIQQMSAGNKIAAALIVALLGMLITFIVLILLWGLIGIMTKVLDRPKKQQPEAAPIVAKPDTPIATEEEEDDALIAVISAAIAASIQRPIQTIVVKNIKRTTDRMPAWASVAKHEQLDSRRF